VKALNVVSTAYRATLEEQDDTVVWLMHSLRDAGADVSVLLRGNAVNYGVRNQDASGLSFGRERQTQPPEIVADLEKLIAKGVRVWVVGEDVAARGIERRELVDGLTVVAATDVPGLFGQFDRVWHW
jgi:intracellular sulfur oxidation DsrE/DsrF family protein